MQKTRSHIITITSLKDQYFWHSPSCSLSTIIPLYGDSSAPSIWKYFSAKKKNNEFYFSPFLVGIFVAQTRKFWGHYGFVPKVNFQQKKKPIQTKIAYMVHLRTLNTVASFHEGNFQNNYSEKKYMICTKGGKILILPWKIPNRFSPWLS